eukprot:comp15363_c1_seq1/m.12257 comp15363_c1_seq1/g.12257  ORF comp15363_c1_seq1/g.12257 comp15363_c1_seq1/m.12257 type:complete len:173 (-) comp15363_c1_seq1:143-661(-)
MRFRPRHQNRRGALSWGWHEVRKERLWLSGKQRSILAVNKGDSQSSGGVVVYESLDEKVGVLIPATTLLTLNNGVDNGDTDTARFHGPGVFSVKTRTGLSVYVLKHPTPHTVAVAQCVMLDLSGVDSVWWSRDLKMECDGAALLALRDDGKASLWTLLEKKPQQAQKGRVVT